ncbi:Promethin [Nibea albiflora]|uniref:Promethin n=1 Tax=Nibea albiflora TaxID=240163 RepID=A0ACB7EXV5_NIBAL|nr:Promethin [Nibea albiflora]
MEHSSSVTEFQQLWGGCTLLANYLYNDPKVSQLMNTRMGQYLSSHPALSLAVLLFSVMAALPVGLFLSFALVTIIMSAVGFVFFEAFLLFVGGLSLLCVLSAIALFSVVVSFIAKVLYIAVSNLLKCYYPHLTQDGKLLGKESETEEHD